MKIVFLDSHTLNSGDLDWSPLEQLGELTRYDRTSAEQTLQRCLGAQIIITNKVALPGETLSQLPELQCICVAATGYNIIDIEAAKELNIRVMNVAGYSTTAVAQHVFAQALALTNKIAYYAQTVNQGRWTNSPDFSYWDVPIMELAGKTMGIYGFGKIGQRVAKIALAFDMQVVAVNKYPDRNPLSGVQFVDSEALFTQSDFLTLHVPLTSQTKHLINKDSLQKMKSGAFLLNTGRGDLIEENDLAAALRNNEIAGAALDVLTQEPPPADHPLIGLDNCLITPHQAWASQGSRNRLLNEICKNIVGFRKGELRNLIV